MRGIIRRFTGKIGLIILISLLAVVVISIITAVSATNIVSGSRADELNNGVSPNDVKPDQCAGINVQNVIDFAGGELPTGNNDLILGGTGVDVLIGLFGIHNLGGNDCIVGGAGNDDRWIFVFHFGLNGGPGNDVILGGPGDDYLIGGGGEDYCYGGGGSDTYSGCEHQW
ncbi:MAG: hypothetical protein DRI56_02510 [Chloroflexota bacterium]|nr:MAG: hypothetical protein DRI56_02510 [Chloroflexota bacterium]